MRKLLIYFLFASLLCLSNTIFATNTLTCNDIVGLWRGTLQGNPNLTLTSVGLNIEDTGGNSMEDANMSFSTSDWGNFSFGMLQGSCQQNQNGTITMSLSRNSFGISSNIALNLLNQNNLQVTSFSLYAPWINFSASGTLKKTG